MMKFFLDQTSFSIAINILNIIFLVSSFYFFFRALNVKNTSTFIFFVILFYIYIPNWIWVFWKLADIYFLFIFSVSFYFLSIGLRKNKFNYLFYSFCICLILLITKPQGLVSIPFFIYSLLFIKFYKKNFFSMKFLIFILYFLFFPFLVYVMIKLDFQNYITRVFTEGRVSFNILISYKDFLNQFSLISSNISELFYYYYLFIQKLIFQLTFVRETYSYSHNIFLLIYILTIYLLFVINLDYLVKNYNLFFKLTVSITFFSILLYCSTFTGSEPNRFQIFHLVPIYILVCLSISRSLRVFFNIIFK